jgi:alpha-L-fucosidase
MRQAHRPLGRLVTTSQILVIGLLLASSRGTARDLSPRVPEPAPCHPIPTPQHLRWHARQFYAFVHFNMNTFTGVEWGDGAESPERFNPTAFDADQWCGLFKACGLTGVIITAKHHDGFCLWPSAYTEHDVAGSPWRNGEGDVMRELADACARHGLFLGVYISPWDRNNPLYGRDDDAYNHYFNGQLEELLGEYGPIAAVWWDGANGDRNDPEKHQEYDWAAFNQTVRRLQPNAVIFAPPYADPSIGVRWVGNERGYADATQWAMHPMGVPESPALLNTGDEHADVWFPAEADVSIRPGWYWRAETDDEVKTVDELLEIYYNSVGHNTNLLLNFAVDRRGLVHESEATALRGMTRILRATFDHDLAQHQATTATASRGGDDPFYAPSRATDGDNETYWATDDNVTTGELTVAFDEPTTFNRIMLREHIELGQRVRAWELEAKVDEQWRPVATGTTIGYKRIVRFDAVTADALRVRIIDSRACPTISTLGVYVAPPEVKITPGARVFMDQTTVRMAADLPDCAIQYTLDGSQPGPDSPVYDGPIIVMESAIVRAVAVREGAVSPRIAELKLIAYEQEDLLEPVRLDRTPNAGLRVCGFDGGWQTLDQMAHRELISEGVSAGFELDHLPRAEHAALAFTGFIHAPRDGVYEFFTTSDDGSRLLIAGRRVVENNGLHGMVERSGHIGLRAGLHPVRVEYFNATGGRGLEVRWAGPGFEKQTLPAERLSH